MGAHGISDSPCTLVPPMGAQETREMWGLYGRRGGVEFRPGFSYEDVVAASRQAPSLRERTSALGRSSRTRHPDIFRGSSVTVGRQFLSR